MTVPTQSRRVLQLIAALVAIGFGAIGCKVRVGDKIEPNRMAQTGPETWEIDGKAYSIVSTYYLVLPPGEQLQYTIEYPISDPKLLDGMDDARAAELAMPLMKYAWQKRLFERSMVSSAKSGTLKPSLIGVAITYREGGLSRGFRVHRSIDAIASAP